MIYIATSLDTILCSDEQAIGLSYFETLTSEADANFLNKFPECIKSMQFVKLFKVHLIGYISRCAYYTFGEFLKQVWKISIKICSK